MAVVFSRKTSALALWTWCKYSSWSSKVKSLGVMVLSLVSDMESFERELPLVDVELAEVVEMSKLPTLSSSLDSSVLASFVVAWQY